MVYKRQVPRQGPGAIRVRRVSPPHRLEGVDIVDTDLLRGIEGTNILSLELLDQRISLLVLISPLVHYNDIRAHIQTPQS